MSMPAFLSHMIPKCKPRIYAVTHIHVFLKSKHGVIFAPESQLEKFQYCWKLLIKLYSTEYLGFWYMVLT